ncbi:hypothetical protein RJ640_011307 [Escallonia rubra]|uniref:DUF4283 domain-containing protein n=1 Tax=Escallonia rubra TaxID=112253 RepID=A0AA88UBN3_9ASTE|nr:hypothetical protein RJ640_011307 [Escallonia rubra]
MIRVGVQKDYQELNTSFGSHVKSESAKNELKRQRNVTPIVECITALSTMKNVWRTGQGRNRNVEIKQVGDNLFLIQFQNHGDKTRVLEGCPWAFEKSLIFIKEYEGDIQPSKIDLHWCPFWIHVINLPFNRMDRDTYW